MAKWLGAIGLDGRRPAHHELLHADGEGCRVEQDLPVLCQEADDILYEHHKVLRQQLIRLRGQEACLKHDGHLVVSAAEACGDVEAHLLLIFTVTFVTFTSSITIIWTLSTFATPFLIKSSILPGVAMTTCTDLRNKNKPDNITLTAEEGQVLEISQSL